MSLTLTVVPGKTFAATEKLTIPKINQLGQPTVTGTVNFDQLEDWNSVALVSHEFTYVGALDELSIPSHLLTAPVTVDNVLRAFVATAGTLPAGLVASDTAPYYVRVSDANKITLHTSALGALNNTERVSITSAGTGTHTIVWTPYALGVSVIFNAATSKFELGELDRVSLPEMIGATVIANGSPGAVPQPLAADVTSFLRGDGRWTAIATPSGLNLFNSMTHY